MIVRGTLFVLVALAVSLGVIAFAQFQSKGRAPRLTTDDVRARRSAPTVATGESASGPLVWQHTMSGALQEAKANGGLIIVDIYTDWCGWCKRMDKDIYEAPSVVALAHKDVFLKYNAEDGGEGEAFAKKMGVRGYPTTFILNGDGKLLQTARGYQESPQRFVSLVESTRAQ